MLEQDVENNIILEPQTTIYKWMFGETTIFYIKIWNHPIETTIYKWLFGVRGCNVYIYIPPHQEPTFCHFLLVFTVFCTLFGTLNFEEPTFLGPYTNKYMYTFWDVYDVCFWPHDIYVYIYIYACCIYTIGICKYWVYRILVKPLYLYMALNQPSRRCLLMFDCMFHELRRWNLATSKIYLLVKGICITHRIHGTGLYLHEWLMFMVNVATVNIPYMDAMGFAFLLKTRWYCCGICKSTLIQTVALCFLGCWNRPWFLCFFRNDSKVARYARGEARKNVVCQWWIWKCHHPAFDSVVN